MDREAWRAAIHGVAKNRTRLSDWTELNWYESAMGLHNGTSQFAKCFCKYKRDEIYRGYGIGHIFIYQKPEAQKFRWLVWKVKMLVAQCVWLFVTVWTVIQQAPLSMEFSRQEYWSGLPCPPPEDHPNPGIKPVSLASPALAGRFFTTEPPGKHLYMFV